MIWGLGDPDAKFQKWQARTIEQLGSINNALFVLALALVAGVTNVGLHSAARGDAWVLNAMIGALVGAIFSILCGVAVGINRLHDFRLTAQVASHVAVLGGQPDEERRAEIDRARVERLGQWTWRLLYAQLASWLAGLLSFALGLWKLLAISV